MVSFHVPYPGLEADLTCELAIGDYESTMGGLTHRGYGFSCILCTLVDLCFFNINKMAFHIVVLYMDMKYGLQAAPWDDEPDDETKILKTLQGFGYVTSAQLYTAVLWVHPNQVTLMTKCMEAAGYRNLQMLYWYKDDINMSGPVFRMNSAVEVAIVGYYGNVKAESRGAFNLPVNPVMRHNMIIGPSKRNLSKNAKGEPINIHEKPDYLSEFIIPWFSNIDQWVLVAGFGAGGDVRGILNADRNVCAIEKDPVQYATTSGLLRKHVPKADVSMVVTNEEMMFGHRTFSYLKRYEKETHSWRTW